MEKVKKMSDTDPLLPNADGVIEPLADLDISEAEAKTSWKNNMKNCLSSIFTTSSLKYVVMGGSDGICVPFALSAGVAYATESTRAVQVAVLAELFAGAFSMGVGGFFMEQTEEQVESSLMRKYDLNTQGKIKQKLVDLLKPVGVTPIFDNMDEHFEQRKNIVEELLKIQEDDSVSQVCKIARSSITVGGSYFLAGIIPALPYFLISNVKKAMMVSFIVGFLWLVIFGGLIGKFAIGSNDCGVISKQAAQYLIIGSLAVLLSFVSDFVANEWQNA